MAAVNSNSSNFFELENKRILITGSLLLILVWFVIDFLFQFSETILNPDSDSKKYYLSVSLASLIITHLIGYLIYNKKMIEVRVQHKFDEIMNSLVLDDEGNKKFKGDPKQSFTANEWIRLSIEQHLNLLEVSMIPDRLKLEELRVILKGIDPVKDPLQHADTVMWIVKKHIFLGNFQEACDICVEVLQDFSEEQEHAEGIIRAALGLSFKKLGDSKNSLTELEKAVIMIPKGDSLRWVAAKKDLLRLIYLREKTIPEPEQLEEIHDVLKGLAKSNDGAAGGIESWRINSAMESYYDLYSMFLASSGELQWATRYSFAATVLAESRTGHPESTFSISHLSRHLMESNEFRSAMNLLDEKRAYLAERGNSRGWVNYNIARCHFGLQEFDEAIINYLEASQSNISDADILLSSQVGLYYSYLKIGDDKLAAKHKKKAQEMAKSTGFEAVWKEPATLPSGSTHSSGNWKISKRAVSWSNAISMARKDLGITGFEPIRKGNPLYKRAKELYSKK